MKIYSNHYTISKENSKKIIEHFKDKIKSKSIYLGGGYFGLINNKILEINTLSINRNKSILSELENRFKFKLKAA
tara:strand:- start:2534 stop:2758 length:225 start_codon:yes stop_codon:yes gene_type:complete